MLISLATVEPGTKFYLVPSFDLFPLLLIISVEFFIFAGNKARQAPARQ